MFTSRIAAFAVLSALVGSSVADFRIISPGGSDLWWGRYLISIAFSLLTPFTTFPSRQFRQCPFVVLPR